VRPTTDFVSHLEQWLTTGDTLLVCQDVDLNVNDFIELVSKISLRVTPSRQGLFSQVSYEADRDNALAESGLTALHTDGLYCTQIPDYGLLYCVDVGKQSIPTVFLDSSQIVAELRARGTLRTLEQLVGVYGNESGQVTHDIVGVHPRTKKPILQLGASGLTENVTVKTPSALGRKEISESLGVVYSLLETAECRVHRWTRGDVVVFDNHRMLHARGQGTRDKERRLLRIWMSRRS